VFMDICLNLNSKMRGGKVLASEIKNFVGFVLLYLHLEAACLSINFVSEKKIRSMNKFFRKKDKVTDVLSFSVCDGEHAEFSGVNDLGDIFICLPVIRRQAVDYGVGFESELRRMVAHGILHLAGYDHECSRAEEIKMFSLQEKILLKYGQEKN